VLGMFERGETVERVDRAEAGVAGAGAVAAVAFEVGEEGADQCQVIPIESRDTRAFRLLAYAVSR
jgi:hypothetical protein